MVFNEEFLFLHIPKTGGTSVSAYLLRNLAPPVYFVGNLPAPGLPPGRVRIPGEPHTPLAYAQRVTAGQGLALEDFRAIVVAVRNPYDMLVSAYSFMQSMRSMRAILANPGSFSTQQLNATETFWQLALDEDFHRMAIALGRAKTRKSLGGWMGGWSQPERYCTLNGEIPPNLTVVRIENIAEELGSVLDSLGIEMTEPIPRLNASPHLPASAYYTTEAEEAVYETFRWVFDQGYYARMSAEEVEGAAGRYAQALEDAKSDEVETAGPVAVTGPVTGHYADRWVGKQLVVPVAAEAHVGSVVVSGALPSFAVGLELAASFAPCTPAASTAPAGPSSSVTIDAPGVFDAEIPIWLSAGEEGVLTISASSAWTRAERHGRDTRHLAYYLNALTFRGAPVTGGAATGLGQPVVVDDAETGGVTVWQSIRSDEDVSSLAVAGTLPPGPRGGTVSVTCAAARGMGPEGSKGAPQQAAVRVEGEGEFTVAVPVAIPSGVYTRVEIAVAPDPSPPIAMSPPDRSPVGSTAPSGSVDPRAPKPARPGYQKFAYRRTLPDLDSSPAVPGVPSGPSPASDPSPALPTPVRVRRIEFTGSGDPS